MPSFDVIIAGLGAMGSAAAYHLARRGLSVLGLEQFASPHNQGSSHGQTRAIREAYFEHPQYVPIVQRAYELWAELEEATRQRLLQFTGGLMIGPQEGALVKGAQASAELHELRYEVLSPQQVATRFQVFTPPEGMTALYEPRAGVLAPELCIQAHLAAAQRHGAIIHTQEPVLGWEAEGTGVCVTTAQGEYHAGRLVVSAGAWVQKLLPDLPLPLQVERMVLCWFEPRAHAERFRPENCPLAIWEHQRGHFFCTFPDMGQGVKVARHHDGEPADPDTVPRTVRPEEVDDLRRFVERLMPEANGELVATAVCMYTNTPDFDFVIDNHPVFPQVLIVSPCSGHGFKFSAAIGEVTADLVTTGRSRFDLAPFRLARFQAEAR